MVAAVFVDAHCHLDECADPIAVVNSARRAGAVIIAVTSSPTRYRAAVARFGGVAQVRVSLGLHPLSVGRSRPRDIETFAEHLGSARYIGEVGLDRSHDGQASWGRQIETFERLLGLPNAKAKLWSVHTRRAEAVAIPMLAQAKVPTVLHWYSGSLSVLERALEAGMYFSVNPAMLTSASGQRIVRALPPDRVLTETDAPYGRSSNGGDPAGQVVASIRDLAARWGWTPEEARRQVFDNMRAAVALTGN